MARVDHHSRLTVWAFNCRVELTPNQSAKLKQGDVLIVGTTHLQVCFPGDVDETAAGEENVAAVKSSE